MTAINKSSGNTPWNKGKLIGQKLPLKLEEVWAIRIRLEISKNIRNLALFNIAIDSKLRACDLVKLKVLDVSHAGKVQSRAMICQQKTGTPVQFEITEKARKSLMIWIQQENLSSSDFLFKSRADSSKHISTRQYARIVDSWAEILGLDASAYGTHSIRRTKASLIYKQTKNLRAVQLLLGHAKLESTVRYLGVEIDDALEIAEKINV